MAELGHVAISKCMHKRLKLASGRYNLKIRDILDTLIDMYVDDEGRIKRDDLKEKLSIIELTEVR